MAVVADGSGGFYIGGDFTRLGPCPDGTSPTSSPTAASIRAFNPSPERRRPSRWHSPGRPSTSAGISARSPTGRATASPPSTPRPATRRAGTRTRTDRVRRPRGLVAGPSTPVASSGRSAASRSLGSPPSTPPPARRRIGIGAQRYPPRPVYALAVSGSNRLCRRQFSTRSTAEPRNYLGALDGDTGNVTGWDPQIGTRNTRSTRSPVSGDTVYAGGDFGSIGGQRRPAWPPSTPPPPRSRPGIRRRRGGHVRAISRLRQTVYVGGALQRDRRPSAQQHRRPRCHHRRRDELESERPGNSASQGRG